MAISIFFRIFAKNKKKIMENFIAHGVDTFGNRVYLSKITEDNLDFSFDLKKAIIFSKEDKAKIRQIGRKKVVLYFEKNHSINYSKLEFQKLDKSEYLNNSTFDVLTDMGYAPMKYVDVMDYINKKDAITLECKVFASSNLEGINNLHEFGIVVAKSVLEKHNLPKK